MSPINKTFKDTIESNPAIIMMGFLFVGFMAGIGTMTFVEAREDRLERRIIDRLENQVSVLEMQNTSLLSIMDTQETLYTDTVAEYREKLIAELSNQESNPSLDPVDYIRVATTDLEDQITEQSENLRTELQRREFEKFRLESNLQLELRAASQ